MAVAERTDPYLGFRYRVEIDGLLVGGFSEVSGLQVEIETEDYQEGGKNGYIHKLPKPRKHPNLVLKRGITDSDSLWKWHSSVRTPGKAIDRKTVRIIVLDTQGQEKVSWVCLRAYPVKWIGPNWKSDSNGVALETMELVHCGIEPGKKA